MLKTSKFFFTTSKVGNYFSNKNKTPHELKSNVVNDYKCSKDKSIKCIEYTSRPQIERVKEYLKGKSVVSDHIYNFNICKNERTTVNNFSILKECTNKLEALISEAILIKRYYPILKKQLTKPGITHKLIIFDKLNLYNF